MKKILLLMVVVLVGCGSWQKTTLISYQAIGETLISAKTVLKDKCDNGEIDATKCEEIKNLYNKALVIYKEAGDIAFIAIDFEDKASQKQYFKMKVEILNLLKSIDELTKNGNT